MTLDGVGARRQARIGPGRAGAEGPGVEDVAAMLYVVNDDEAA